MRVELACDRLEVVRTTMLAVERRIFVRFFLQYIPVGSATISHIRDSYRRHVFILHNFKKSCLRRDGGI